MSLTEQGFERPSFDEIRGAIVDRMRDIYGPINTGPESAIGQQISIMAERENSLWDAQESVYLSQYPDSASGRSLDGAAQLTGVTRQGATKTSAIVALDGKPGTIIPAGSQVSNDVGGVFETAESVDIGSEPQSVQILALAPGPFLALANTITNIETPVPGWDSVNNPNDGDVGRAVETDPEFRERRIRSLAVTGAGTVEAIRSRILEQIDDVSAVTVLTNRTDRVDDGGRPPHSFEAIVQGGVDQDIGDLIWQIGPAGIPTHGNVSVGVTDSQDMPHTVEFTRPVEQYIWARVTLTADGSRTFPDTPEPIAKASIVDKGESLSVGDDVHYQAFFGPLYRAIPGLELAEIEIGASDDAESEPSYSAGNIDIAGVEIATFLADRITVTVRD